MNDAQVWATIIGTFVLLWHVVNRWTLTRVSRDALKAVKDKQEVEAVYDRFTGSRN